MDEVVNWVVEDCLIPEVGVGFEVIVLVEEGVACLFVDDFVVPGSAVECKQVVQRPLAGDIQDS